MLFIQDDGKMGLAGDFKTLLSQGCTLIQAIFDLAKEKGQEIDDKLRFTLLMPLIFNGKRLDKLSTNPQLQKDVDLILDEVWKSVELLEHYIDTYEEDNNEI